MLVNTLTIKLFDLICVNDIKNLDHILNILNISERKFRYELDVLSDILYKQKFGKINLKNKNISFRLSDSSANIINYLNKYLKLSTIERIDYIFMCLISSKYISLSKIANELFVTKSTIKKDLIKLQENLHNIHIDFDNKYFLNGEEIDIRKKSFETLSTIIFENKINKVPKSILVSYDLSLLIYNTLNDKYSINNNIIFVYIFVLIIRLKNRNILKGKINKNITNKKLYFCINNSLKLLKNENISIPNYEVFSLYEFIENVISNRDMIINDKWIEFKIITRNFIDNISKTTNIPFIKDKILLSGLEKHIPQSIYRCKNNMKLGNLNYLFDEFSTNKLIKIVNKEIEYIENIFSIKFNLEEILLYTVHFQASIERNNNICKNYKKILLLCVGGYGTTKILINKLNSRYNLDKIDIISIFQIKQMCFLDYDILISTIDINNINFKGIKNKIKISPFLTNKELKKLDEFFEIKSNSIDYENLLLNLKENKKIDNKQKQNLINEFNTLKRATLSNKIFNNIEFCAKKFNTWEDTIYYGVKKMVELNSVDMDYANKIIDNIKQYGSYMIITKNIALPHASINNSKFKTCLYVLYLKYPIIFPERKRVKLLFFVYINPKDKTELIDQILKIIDKGYDLNKIENLDDLKFYLYK